MPDAPGKHAGSSAIALPPVPSLETRHLRHDAVQTPLGKIDALIPEADIYVCKAAERPALLLIPGLGMDGNAFIRQLPLGALCDLYFFQTPNGRVAGEEGLGHYARFVEEYILARGLDRRPAGLILGGASMGGAITQMVALRGRVKLRGMILLGTFGSSDHLKALQRFAAPLAWIVPMNLIRSIGWRFAGWTRYKHLSLEEARWHSVPVLRRTQGYFGRAVKGLTRLQLIAGIAKLRIPTLVVHGSADTVLPLKAGRQLAETIPGARFLVVPNAGHSVHFSRCEEVNSAIAEFISVLPPN